MQTVAKASFTTGLTAVRRCWLGYLLALCAISPGLAQGTPTAIPSAPTASPPRTAPLQWTERELAWLRAHPRITVGINDAWPPMDYVDEQGLPRGIGVDFIHALNQRLDGALHIVPGSWETIYDAVREGSLDALMDITPRKDRQPDFHFTSPYIHVPHIFLAREGHPYIHRLEDLNGKSLAVERGFYLVTHIREHHPGIRIAEYDTTSDALDAVSRGIIDAYAGNRAAASFVLHNEVITNLETHGRLRESASINAIGVRKDAPMLAQILQKALDDISLRERMRILETWSVSKPLVGPGDLALSNAEWRWLEEHPIIRVASDPKFPPIEFIDDDGHLLGIAPEYLEILSDALGVRFEHSGNIPWQEAVNLLQNRQLDMFSAAAATPNRVAYAVFTEPYLQVPVMIFSRHRGPYIASLSEFAGKKVALVEDYAVSEMVRADAWGLEILTVPNIVSGLRAVRSGAASAFIGDTLTTSYYIRKHGLTDVHIVGPAPYRLDLSMGVRDDWSPLVPILNKTLDKLSEPQRGQIAARWIGIQVQEPADYARIWQGLAAAVLLVLLILSWNWNLRRKVAQHTAQIRGQNHTLEERRRALEERQQALAAAQRIARLGSWQWDLKRGRFEVSEVLLDILGLDGAEALRNLDEYLSFVDPGERAVVGSAIRDAIAAGERFEHKYTLDRADGKRAFVHEQGEVYNDGNGAVRVSSTVQDISEQHLAESKIHKLQQAFDKSPGAIVISDLDNHIEYVNAAFTRNTGYASDEVIGRNSIVLLAPPSLRADYRRNWEEAKRGQVWHGELLSHKKNGEPFWEDVTIAPVIDHHGNVANLLELRQDISSQKAIEERLFNEVNFCPLTRLPNQAYLLNELRQARDRGQTFSLLFVDLLNLKRINDSLGFEAGDALIIQAARRLDTITRKPDILSHLGGGQYLVHLTTDNATLVEQHVGDIFACFETSFHVGAEHISQSICVGVVRCPEDGDEPSLLLTRAYVAANQAKHRGTANWCYFSPEYSQQSKNLFHMENLLAQALDRNELAVVYQPKIDITSGRPVGAEALLRWYNDELGQVPPNQFIPVAEQNDLIIRIGRWVISQGIQQAKCWQEQGFENFNLAINLSPKQFLDTQLVSFIESCLRECSLPGELLELELTESLLMEDSEKIFSQMEKIKAMGIRLVLDDFGTGFSSLSYLQKFPFDGLKIDRSFIYDYPSYQGNVGLIKAIIAMGKALGMTLVAEGVETQEQADFLASEDCVVFQGYLYGKPMAQHDLTHWLQRQRDPQLA